MIEEYKIEVVKRTDGTTEFYPMVKLIVAERKNVFRTKIPIKKWMYLSHDKENGQFNSCLMRERGFAVSSLSRATHFVGIHQALTKERQSADSLETDVSAVSHVSVPYLFFKLNDRSADLINI